MKNASLTKFTVYRYSTDASGSKIKLGEVEANTVEEAERGMKLLKRYVGEPPRTVEYPDCRQIRIVE
jgi:hypothetical protein